jgi:hypothetical protein
MPVKVDPDIDVTAKTVGELRILAAWPENLAITTPQDGYLREQGKRRRRTSPKS